MSTRVKICGLKTDASIDAAVSAGADMIGLVFFPKSPRHVDLAQAERLARHAAGRVDLVALTVDADDALLGQIVDAVRPHLLQLHGREAPERAAAVRSRFGVRVMKALAVATRDDVRRADDYRSACDLILFDAKPPPGADLPGGNGRTFDWSLLSGVAAEADYMLSGGLTPGNVADALRATGAAMVDVSSGVESAPGEKDAQLIRAFVAAAKGARGQP